MEFPVDTLVSVTHEQLELSGHAYMDDLLHADPEHPHYLLLPTGRKVQIRLSSVGFVPLYGVNLEHKVLAVFAPEDPLTAVALLMSERWYPVETLLRTADPQREGLFQVKSVVERVVLYVLNRIVYRTNEMATGDMPFLCHNKTDYAKILWKGGEAVGFYSIQTEVSWSRLYHLPVMNSIFVRKGHRGNGHGLQMLEDFVDSFKEDELGLKYPLSPAMSQVCRRYLTRYPADVDLLWEVEGMGGPYQRTHLASRLNALALTGGQCQDDHKNGEPAKRAVDVQEKNTDATEEADVVNQHVSFSDEDSTSRAISTHTRSSEHSWRKRAREEPVEGAAESQPLKISRGEEPNPEPVQPLASVISAVELKEAGEDEEEEPPAGGKVEASLTSEATALEQEAKIPVMELNGSGAGGEESVPEQDRNGTAREEEKENEGEEGDQAAVNSMDTLKESVTEEFAEKKQGVEAVSGPSDKQEMETNPTIEEKQDEETATGVEGEQKQEVAPTIEDVGIGEDCDEEPSVSDDEDEAGPLSEEMDEKKPEPAEVPPSPEGVMPETVSLEEAPAPPEEGEPEMKDEEHLCGRPGGAMGTPKPSPEHEAQKEHEHEEASEEQEAGQKVSKVGGALDGNTSHMLLDAAPPDVRLHRGGRSKGLPMRPKRTSRKPDKAAPQDEEGLDEAIVEDEDRGPSTEDEKATTDEEAEHSSVEEGNGGESQVIDMRVLRGKTKVYPVTPQHRAKRRGKM